MKLKPWQRNALSMLVIVAIGYVLFLAAFILAAMVINGVSSLSGTSGETPYRGMVVYVIIILLCSWFVFKSPLNDLIKATYLTMPLMIFLMLDGILLNQQPQWIMLLVGALIVVGLLFYLYKKERSWLYYFATTYVTVLALYVKLSGMQI